MTYVHTWVDTIMIQLFTIVYGAFVVTLLEAASHYGRRSRGQRLPPIILQETKNSVARPFTLEGKNQRPLLSENAYMATIFDQGNKLLKEVWDIHEWKPGHFSWYTFGLHLVRGPKAL